MLNLGAGWFTAHYVEDLDDLGVGGVDNGKNIRAKRDVSLGNKLNLKTLILGGRDKFSLIRVNVEVLACVDQSEIFCSLND